jgi:hypothetical protein
MTNLQIKERIDQNNKMIESLLNPSMFTLNNSVKDLLNENDSLQALCKHSFVDGYCEYCYKSEDEDQCK